MSLTETGRGSLTSARAMDTCCSSWYDDLLENFTETPLHLNPHLIYQATSGFANLFGIDYSQAAIDLAKEVAEDKELENIEFSVADLVDQTFAEEHR